MINHERQEQYDFVSFGLTCFVVGTILGALICLAFLEGGRNKSALERQGCVEARAAEKAR